MKARSILTYDKLKDDEYGNNISFMVSLVCMDDDVLRCTYIYAQEGSASLSQDEKMLEIYGMLRFALLLINPSDVNELKEAFITVSVKDDRQVTHFAEPVFLMIIGG